LNQLILETVEILSRTRKDVVAHIALADDLWPIRADKEQIEQVLLNLIANAFEAMPEGGDLFLKTSNVPAPRSAESADPRAARDYVWLEVSDTGKGMDEATLKRVFEPYFTTKEMGRGTGLGLAAVHGIVESHQGNIRVSSEKGRGTTFSILLPDCRELHASTAGGRGAWPVVLVVDDEDFVLETVVNMLKRLGCTVFSASSGKEAIALFVQNRDKIGVVLLDMVMPGVGAAQISATIKSIRRDVKIILSSGLSEGRIEDEQLLKGVDAFLQKPYTIKDLSRMIRTVSADGAV
jgi:CheY-like chemotaxis protein